MILKERYWNMEGKFFFHSNFSKPHIDHHYHFRVLSWVNEINQNNQVQSSSSPSYKNSPCITNQKVQAETAGIMANLFQKKNIWSTRSRSLHNVTLDRILKVQVFLNLLPLNMHNHKSEKQIVLGLLLKVCGCINED